MLAFYWSLGRDIVEMHVEDRWGESVVRNLSADLKKLNPEAHCFSKSNIYYMKKFYLYCVEIEHFVQQPIGQEDKQIVQQVVGQLRNDILSIPWGHHILIMSKVPGNPKKALFFIQQDLLNGWSRDMLLNFLSTDLYERQGKALNNFTATLPPEGSYAFIYDYETFSIPGDVLVVGIENSENFRRIRQQRWLFDRMFPDRRILFVSRYPQNESHDLVKWLGGIPNEYVHFGDLDLAGIRIFLTEFHRYLGSRSSFLIPPDYETRISNGSRERYDAQLPYTKRLTTDNPHLQQLIDCIHKYHRGYDQEGFCAPLVACER